MSESTPPPPADSDPNPGPSPDAGDDHFAPPKTPCECYCLHCGRVFMSDGIWFQKIIGGNEKFDGFWMCPTPNCDGAGFGFDIFPTDPDHPANAGWVYSDDDEEDGEESETAEWDPDEPGYSELDEIEDEEDDDLEGEEWKLGLQPGERPPEPPWAQEAREHWEQEEKKYDGPDLRPRELDWSDRPEIHPTGNDDIPF